MVTQFQPPNLVYLAICIPAVHTVFTQLSDSSPPSKTIPNSRHILQDASRFLGLFWKEKHNGTEEFD